MITIYLHKEQLMSDIEKLEQTYTRHLNRICRNKYRSNFCNFHLFHFFSCTLVTCPIFWINDISVVFFNFDQPVFSNIFVSQNYNNCHELKYQIVCFKREWLKTKELVKKQWRPAFCHCLSVISSWIINTLHRKSNARKTMFWKN